ERVVPEASGQIGDDLEGAGDGERDLEDWDAAGADGFDGGERFVRGRGADDGDDADGADAINDVHSFVILSVSEGPGGTGGAPPAHTGPSLTLGMTALATDTRRSPLHHPLDLGEGGHARVARGGH